MSNEFVMVPRELLDRVLDPITSEGYISAKHEVMDLMLAQAEQHQIEPVEVLGYSVKGNRYAIRLTKAELIELHAEYAGDALIELVDRRHLVRCHNEVERLRETIRYFEAAHKDSQQHVAKIEAQLAERDGLLREIKNARDWNGSYRALEKRIDAVLSASAEPSALRGWVCDEPGTPGEWSKSKIKPVAPVGDGVHDDTEAVRAAMERKQ